MIQARFSGSYLFVTRSSYKVLVEIKEYEGEKLEKESLSKVPASQESSGFTNPLPKTVSGFRKPGQQIDSNFKLSSEGGDVGDR